MNEMKARGFMSGQNGGVMESLGSIPVRQTISGEAMEMAERLTQRAQSLADRAHQKLQPIMSPEMPCNVALPKQRRAGHRCSLTFDITSSGLTLRFLQYRTRLTGLRFS